MLFRSLDLPISLGGAGLDKRAVTKILRDLDLILIVGFNLKIQPEKKEATKPIEAQPIKIN